jgi:drug/metabolite transporter (DMT)-like permease
MNYKKKPNWKVLIALLAGFAGVIILVEDMPTLGEGMIGTLAAVAILFGASAWGLGSFYSRTAKMPGSHFLGVAMQMIIGGILLFSASFVTGEFTGLQLANMSLRSLTALVYLIVFGSLVAFTSYIWLLKQIAPSRVATYAYINPVVALLLGLALADEQLTFRSVAAAIIILISVAAITILKSETARPQ